MKIKIFLFTILSLFITTAASAQLTATVTKTDATCPNNGSITINASGGTSPYSYSINGGVSSQPSNVFTNLTTGTYTVRVIDANNAIYDVAGIIIADRYTDMTPTARAANEVCSGSNTGSVTLSMPAGQGTPPYTYSISTDGTNYTVASSNTTSVSYTFNNLAPGKYYVRVTDACGAFQTREATLLAGQAYNLTIHSAYARPSVCGNMDYYLRPGTGTNFPHTYYAYPGGNLSATPTTITVTAADLVPIPGTGFTGFKFTLPNPSTFNGTYYTFKYTDNCVTDVNNPRVIANTPTLGNFNVSLTNRNCGTDMDVKVLEGWKMPVSVKITPTAGGTTIIKTIADEAARLATFTGLTSGVNYTVEVIDDCNRTNSTTFNMYTPAPAGPNVHVECGATIPGTANLTFDGLMTGWQMPVTATINSGPTTHYSAEISKTFTASYPIVSSNSTSDNMIRFYNLAPGTYNITFTDGCYTKTINVTISDHLYTPSLTPAHITGCAGSRRLEGTATSSCSGTSGTGTITTDIKKGTAESVYANGVASPFSLSNIAADVYSIYYYSSYNSNNTRNVFKASSGDLYNGALLLKKEVIQVTDVPTNPKLAEVFSAECNGTTQIRVIPDPSTSNIVGYQMLGADGVTYTPLQTSDIFTVPGPGTYTFRVVDECGNGGVSSITIEPHAVPDIKSGGNTCFGQDITLFVEVPDNATVIWTRPNGSTFQGSQLLIQNASVADKGQYKVTVTYKVGNCSEVQEFFFTLEDCAILPVNWGTLTATIKDQTLFVDWSTLKEINNKYFEIQVSKDGKTWKTIGKVNSLASGGNSETELKYQYQANLKDVMGMLGLPVVLALLALGIKRRSKLLRAMALVALLISIGISCKKNKEEVVTDTDSRVWVRVVQVDEDGTQKTSSVVQAVRE